MKEKIKSLFDEKLWKFLLVGVLNTLVGNGLMFLLYNLTGMSYWAATAVSYALASVMSYFLNRCFTFKFQEKGFRPVARFAANIAVCYLLAYGIAKPAARALLSGRSQTVQENVAMLVGMCLFTGLNYLGQRFFAFRERPQQPPVPRKKLRPGALFCDDRPVQNLLLAFFLPAVILLAVFFCYGIYPVGDKMVLAHDMWHQYYPFFVDFRRKLLEGNSMLYSWTSGLGMNYPGLYAYYLASPIYLLSVFVPEAFLPEFFLLAVLVKVGCCGLFFAVFLKVVFRRCDLTAVAFSLLYALSSFVAGYYWNIIWLDTVALLPLVVAGTIALLRDRRWRLYVTSLFFAVWCNYYISFFVCIFVALTFVGYTICYWDGFKGFFRRLGSIAGCTVLALGMTAVLMIPTYLSLQNTHSAVNKFPTGFSINIGQTQDWAGVLDALRQITSNLLPLTTPTAMTGLPNIYCGFCAVFFGVIFCLNGKFRLRERIFAALLLVFFTVSFIFRQLDYVWHGFHFPNMLPYRFSFLYSFVLLTMAYRAFARRKDIRLWQAIAALVVAAGIAFCGYGISDNLSLVAAGVLAAVCFVLVVLTRYTRMPQLCAVGVLLLLCIGEASVCAYLGVDEAGTSNRNIYPRDGAAVKELLEEIDKNEEGGTDLYRTEVSSYQTLNDASLLGYRGVSVFSSTANEAISNFTLRLGIASWPGSNRYEYLESSPFTNLMLNVKYIIDREGNTLDPDYTRTIAASGDVLCHKNTAYLPMGFVMREDILNYDVTASLRFPMTEQNDLFSLATGISDALYKPIEPSALQCGENCTLKAGAGANVYNYNTENASQSTKLTFTYTFDEPTLFCLYFQSSGINEIDISANGAPLATRNVKVGSILCLGSYDAGDVVEVSCTAEEEKASGRISLQAGSFNTDAFDRGYEMLSRSTMDADKITDTCVCGTIDVQEDGLFYTSIPYEDGWTATLDGETVEITPVGGAFIAFPITAGEHTVALSFTPPGFLPGLVISSVCFAVYVVLLVVTARKKRTAALPPLPEGQLLPEPEPSEEEQPEAPAPDGVDAPEGTDAPPDEPE